MSARFCRLTVTALIGRSNYSAVTCAGPPTLYDAASRPIASINAENDRTTSLYDAAGRYKASVDPLGDRMTSLYDAAGRNIAAINALGDRTTMIYNTASQTIAVRDPERTPARPSHSPPVIPR